MVPAPNREHQDLRADLHTWLRIFWAKPRGNRVHGPVNLSPIGGWPDDYRIPDLLLLTPDRFATDHNEYFEGPTTAVVEIRSPDDETTDKLEFYAKLGVPEVWVIDRDTRRPQLLQLAAGGYGEQNPDPAGWLRSAATGIRFRSEPDNKLAIQMGTQRSTRKLLPEPSGD